jgi:putative heme-binding domain-containing protein
MNPAPAFICGLCICLVCVNSLSAQSVPKERRITYREKSLKTYEPFSAEELWKKIKIPPAPALSPEEALKSFKLAPGFRVELVAAEPLVVDPVQFEFDPDGRIWAVEFRGWMLDIDGTGEGDPIGQVVVLEDTDGDTVMDKSTVFLDKLVMPRTVACVEGGVLIAEPPNLWYCRDTDGDLKCDSKQLVGQYGRPGNPEHTDNALMPGIDNWMHSADSNYRHRFRDGKLTQETSFNRGQWGMTQDDYGRRFYNYENRPLHADLFPSHYAFRNCHLRVGRSTTGLNHTVVPRTDEVYPIRVTPGITLGGNELRPDGTLRTFTIACGPSIYRGTQFPEKYHGSAVIPEAAGNLIRLAPFTDASIQLRATNAFNQMELLASTDERFRPVCSRTGPDGALYFCDLYRGIIEHVIFMMPYLRNQILSRGLDTPVGMGRIYRIMHEDEPLGETPRMSGQSSAELVAYLSHSNGWWRDTAQRLLVERKARDVTPALRVLAINGADPRGRMHALWTLDGIADLDWPTVLDALNDSSEMTRATAVRLSERFFESESRKEIISALRAVASDKRPLVRLQLALSLGELKGDEAEGLMADVLSDRPTHVFRVASVSGLMGRELEFIERMRTRPDWDATKEKGSWVMEVCSTAVMNEGKPDRITQLLKLIADEVPHNPWRVEHLLFGALDGNRSRTKWPTPIRLASRPALLDTLSKSKRPNRTQEVAKLLRIITWPGDTTKRAKKPVITPLTAAQQKGFSLGESVYHATCHACHKPNGQGLTGQAPSLVDSQWVNGDLATLARIVLHGLHGPIKVRGKTWNMAMPGLGHSPFLNDERLAAVLTYVRRSWGNTGDPVGITDVAKVRQMHRQRTAMWTAESLRNPDAQIAVDVADAADPLAKYRSKLSGGNANRGRALFHAHTRIRCHACHRAGHMGGGFVGPDLSAVGARATVEQLLQSIIQPSKVIADGFRTVGIETMDGELHSGIIISETKMAVNLGLPLGGSRNIPAKDIREKFLSTVSAMPPVGDIYTPEEIADFVAYLKSLKTETKKAAQ